MERAAGVVLYFLPRVLLDARGALGVSSGRVSEPQRRWVYRREKLSGTGRAYADKRSHPGARSSRGG